MQPRLEYLIANRGEGDLSEEEVLQARNNKLI